MHIEIWTDERQDLVSGNAVDDCDVMAGPFTIELSGIQPFFLGQPIRMMVVVPFPQFPVHRFSVGSIVMFPVGSMHEGLF